ncbi:MULTISPECIES: hypothetical protein [unclassified Saccharicrinis]|uniref:hypothetical protein n=1 Tax=unclassified Saccharicrinis TaxID=2646859 RepID=UPI003D357951
MKLLLLTLTLLIGIAGIRAQVAENPEKVIDELMESLSENDIDLNNQSQIFDDLLELYENPVNINLIEQVDLEKLVFLSDLQIKAILDYMEKMGPLDSKYQLQGAGGLTRTDIERLMMFVTIEPIETKPPYRKHLDGQLILRDQFDVEKAKGYESDSTGSGYYGDRHHLYAKLQLRYGSNWYAGMVMDKDPGEEITPIDFVSGYAMFEGDNLIKTVIIGDYHANFGQGLALWTGTSMGKTSEPLSIRKRGHGFRKYSSANEYAYFRGIATTLAYKNAEFSLFASLKDRDADIGFHEDSTWTIVASMPETGYHRTQSELNKKNKLGQSTYGANLDCRFKNLSVSLGGFSQTYDADSIAVKELYQILAHEKTKSSQYWIAYNYGTNNWLAFGELAVDGTGNPAMINGLQLRPANQVSVALSHRYFSRKYYSPWVNAFSENSFPAGESGFYLAINTLPVPKLKLAGYVDLFKTNWLKYSIDKPSSGYDISFQANYELNPQFKVNVRYREKEKSQNQTIEDIPEYIIATTNIKKVRLHTDMVAHQNWLLQMRVEKSFYKEENKRSTEGILAYTGVKFLNNNHKLSCWLRYSIFDTENYDTRLYAYENDLLYNFYTPAFQGEGSRVYFMAQYQALRNVKLWIKAGRTTYSDRNEISSGLQTINSNTRTNIRMQIQIKF